MNTCNASRCFAVLYQFSGAWKLMDVCSFVKRSKKLKQTVGLPPKIASLIFSFEQSNKNITEKDWWRYLEWSMN